MTPAPGIAYHPGECRPRRGKTRSLTRAGVADAVHRRHGGLSRRESLRLVDVVLSCIRRHLAGGRAVRLTGFGSFRVTRPRPRRIRNPRTGMALGVSGRARAVFRPSGRLIRRLNAPRDSAPGSR